MDYNIYIHTDGATTSQSPTKPWSNEEDGSSFQSDTKPWSNFQGGLAKAVGIAQNPDSLVSSATSSIKKAIPAVAVASLVTGLSMKVISEVNDFTTIASGDYSFQTRFNNFKATLHNAFHPVSYKISREKAEFVNRNANEAQKLNLALYGDSYINSFNGYGV